MGAVGMGNYYAGATTAATAYQHATRAGEQQGTEWGLHRGGVETNHGAYSLWELEQADPYTRAKKYGPAQGYPVAATVGRARTVTVTTTTRTPHPAGPLPDALYTALRRHTAYKAGMGGYHITAARHTGTTQTGRPTVKWVGGGLWQLYTMPGAGGGVHNVRSYPTEAEALAAALPGDRLQQVAGTYSIKHTGVRYRHTYTVVLHKLHPTEVVGWYLYGVAHEN